MGLACRKVKRFQEAAKAYEISVHLNQKNKKALHGLAITYRKLKRYDDSIAICQEILKLDPHYAKVYFNLGLVYEEQGKWDKAIEQHRKALDINPDNPVTQMLMTVVEEEIAWQVIMRLAKDLDWKLRDPATGRELEP